jgi:hypothetical protein
MMETPHNFLQKSTPVYSDAEIEKQQYFRDIPFFGDE